MYTSICTFLGAMRKQKVPLHYRMLLEPKHFMDSYLIVRKNYAEHLKGSHAGMQLVRIEEFHVHPHKLKDVTTKANGQVN